MNATISNPNTSKGLLSVNRQQFALGLAAVYTLGTLCLATAAQAQITIRERELNGTSFPQDIGKVSSVPVRVSGQIPTSQDEDVFRFRLTTESKLDVRLTVDGDVDLEVLQDNGDGKLAGRDSKKISIKDGKVSEFVSYLKAKPGYYFVRIVDSGGALSFAVNYNLNISATPTGPIIQ